MKNMEGEGREGIMLRRSMAGAGKRVKIMASRMGQRGGLREGEFMVGWMKKNRMDVFHGYINAEWMRCCKMVGRRKK